MQLKHFNRDEVSQRKKTEFKVVSMTLTRVLAKCGISTQPFSNESLPHFSNLSEQRQASVLHGLRLLLDACIAHGSRTDIAQNRTLMWRVMGGMGYRPLDDVFDRLSENDLLEIYDENLQISFATPAFFDLTSYSLEDLYCRPWPELWDRPQGAEKEIEKAVSDVLHPENRRTIVLTLPPYEVRETSSLEIRKGFVRTKLFAPLVDPSGRRGFISANQFLGPLP